MVLLILITNKLDYSISTIDYFKFKNPQNSNQFKFLPLGLDEDDELKLKNKIIKKIESFKSLDKVVFISDKGLARKFVKKLTLNNIKDETTILKYHGPLLDDGYLIYMLLNSRSPIEVLRHAFDKNDLEIIPSKK